MLCVRGTVWGTIAITSSLVKVLWGGHWEALDTED